MEEMVILIGILILSILFLPFTIFVLIMFIAEDLDFDKRWIDKEEKEKHGKRR